ncbi:MAG: hypothetical protein GY861_20255 [bacterium]|nr:hypothetical protein [bacterium]
MKYDIEFQIVMEEHFQSLNLDNAACKEAERTLEDAGVIELQNGTKLISIPKYWEYTLSRLEDACKPASKSQSLEILQDYGLIARDFLFEWANIIGNKCYLMADDYFSQYTEEAAEKVNALIDDLPTIYEHLINAYGLLIKYRLAKDKSDTPQLEME